MKSRPPFTIDIAKGDQVLSFGCSFLPSEEGDKDAGNLHCTMIPLAE